jgi:hypothetical protein
MHISTSEPIRVHTPEPEPPGPPPTKEPPGPHPEPEREPPMPPELPIGDPPPDPPDIPRAVQECRRADERATVHVTTLTQ